MRCWQPEPGEPELFDWWRPLLAASARARREEVPWPINIDEFALLGRVERPPRPAIWLYRHEGGGILPVDAQGQPYRFIPNRTGTSAGRFEEVTIRQAIWGASLPDHVEPVGIRHPAAASWCDDGFEDAYADEPESPAWAAPAPATAARQRGHLRLVVNP